MSGPSRRALDLHERYPSPSKLAATSEKTIANRLAKLASA
jgi:hypothetical protein